MVFAWRQMFARMAAMQSWKLFKLLLLGCFYMSNALRVIHTEYEQADIDYEESEYRTLTVLLTFDMDVYANVSVCLGWYTGLHPHVGICPDCDFLAK